MNTQGAKFKPVNEAANITFIRASKLSEQKITGVILTGVYVGSKKNKYNPAQNDYQFEVEDGSTVIINGTAGLSKQMDKVSLGSLVQIEYGGKIELKDGKTAHRFTVSTADNSKDSAN